MNSGIGVLPLSTCFRDPQCASHQAVVDRPTASPRLLPRRWRIQCPREGRLAFSGKMLYGLPRSESSADPVPFRPFILFPPPSPYGRMKPNETQATPFSQTFFHGTKADLDIGDLIEVGFASNFGKRNNARYVFLTATLDAAIWGAELASGEGRERIYLVEPTGPVEDDPDLTNTRFPGNPSMSYRSTHPFKVVGEVGIWRGHSPEQFKAMKDVLERLNQQGVNSLNE